MIETKINRVFVDAYGRPWLLRAVAADAVFIESADEVRSVARDEFVRSFVEMGGAG